jgi:precorrin-2 dehydrogenase
MRTHPVFVRLEGRRCVVVGDGETAAARATACLRAGADVTVVAPGMPASLAGTGIRHVARAYRSGDLAGAFLAYATVRDPDLVRALAEEAGREGVLLNVADVPEASDFLTPAVVERGELRIAIGTGGASPGLAARLRRELERRIGPEYGPFVAILARVRAAVAEDPGRAGDRARVMAELLNSPLLELVRERRAADVDALLGRVAGDGCTLAHLGVALTPEA